MRKHRLMLFIVTAMILGLASFTTAQMMGGNNHHHYMNQSDSTYQSGTMGMGMMGMMNQFDSMMGDMSQYCNTMTGNFDKLESHFEKMMQMDDMTALKKEMRKHYDMMQEMHQNMTRQQNVWHTMMSMMHSDYQRGMMGQNDEGSGQSGNK